MITGQSLNSVWVKNSKRNKMNQSFYSPIFYNSNNQAIKIAMEKWFFTDGDIDYKFKQIRRNDNGYIVEAVIGFYRGEENETGYVRSIKYPQNELTIFSNFRNDDVVFSQADFGQIQTDDELRIFCNGQLNNLAKNKNKRNIAIQYV